jgi:hypothetical protein|tara:strand:- start:3126 stop:3500 length:375 start_codon:yes stop_codon:yes gene_type:complete
LYNHRLAPLGLSVREVTGDTQLSKKEMDETTMLVTTPEKWDVITRKGGEVGAAQSLRLLIVDEVHLLNDGTALRGSQIRHTYAVYLPRMQCSDASLATTIRAPLKTRLPVCALYENRPTRDGWD